MNRITLSCWGLGLLTILGLASLGTPQEPSSNQNPVQVLQDPIEVQARGPVHEAFAQPFDIKPEPGELVPKEPPAPIPEDPPEERPSAENAKWIGGYWAWDAQKQDFLWVSGVYRVPPQGRTFVPGYWSQTANGSRWIPGFWSNAQQGELPYTPEPPAPLDQGPSMPQPDDDSVYVPGSWVYRDTRFIWRAGYYSAARPGRVWNSPYYLWTPNGYLFVDGYWDLPFEDRGLLFAPVYFQRPLWQTAGWRYRPGFVVGFNGFFDSAFYGPGFHLYFGNYYDPFYARNGYRPWYQGRGRYDPVFAHYGWQNYRGNRNWVGGVQQTYANRYAGRSAVPPLTLAQQNAQVRTKQGTRVVTPLNQTTIKNITLVKATPTQLQTQRDFAQQTRQLSAGRKQLDTSAATNGATPRFTSGATLKLPAATEKSSGNSTFRIESSANKSSGSPGTTSNSTVTPRNNPPATTSKGTTGGPPKTTFSTPKTNTPPPQTTTPPPRTTTPPPRVTTPPPRVTTPPPPRPSQPPVRPSPPPARPKKASADVDPPRAVTKAPAPATPRPVAAPVNVQRVQAPAPRVQPPTRVSAPPAPRVQPPARVSAPPLRSNPAPARSSPPPRPTNNKKK